jgi:hypothetical protein
MLSRLDTLSTALVFVGLQVPPAHVIFLVAPDDIVKLACTPVAGTAAVIAMPSVQMTVGLRNSLDVNLMKCLPR